MDLANLDDDQLERHRVDVLNEQERRQRLADTPTLVADLARRYVDDGGNPADLQAALNT